MPTVKLLLGCLRLYYGQGYDSHTAVESSNWYAVKRDQLELETKFLIEKCSKMATISNHKINV